MLNPHLIQGLSGAGKAKLAGGVLLAPVAVLSFIGGMLVWRALQSSTDKAEIDKKLEAYNSELKEQFQALAQQLTAAPNTVPVEPEYAPTAQIKTAPPSSSKLAMLKRVVDDNIKLRETA